MTTTPLRDGHVLPVLLALALLAGCDKGPTDGGEPLEATGVTIVSGANVSDTVDSRLPAPLVVKVVGRNGRPAANAEVAFLATAIAEGSDQPTVIVGAVDAPRGGVALLDTTDAQGRVAARVTLWRTAGPGAVVVYVPSLDDGVLASYTIRPGATRRLVSEPADTAVREGGSVSFRAAVFDRYGNSRPAEEVAYSVLSGPAAVGGGAVTAAGVGRAAIVVQSGTAADTSFLSVVPEGVIAAYTSVMLSNQRARLYTLNLDGTGLTQRAESASGDGYNADMGSTWSGDGAKLFFHDTQSDGSRAMFVHDLATNATQRLLGSPDRKAWEAWPFWSDGWIYFEGRMLDDPLVFRVRADGSQHQEVTPRDGLGVARHPAVSPDGSRLAFVGRYGSPHYLMVMDLATGEARSLGFMAQSPRWLPGGSEIAYIASADMAYGSGELRAVRPDGTGDRPLTAGGSRFRSHFDLSPDGRYAVAVTDQGVLTVIVLASGLEIPVRTPQLVQSLMAPSWRP